MAETLISKSFNEGAPLDPNALNDLRADVVNAYAKASNALYNNNINGQTQNYRFLFNCGEAVVSALQASTPVAIPIDLGNGFEVSPAPIITATVKLTSAPAKGQQINAYVVTSGSNNPQLYVISNVATGSFSVYWTAIQKLPA